MSKKPRISLISNHHETNRTARYSRILLDSSIIRSFQFADKIKFIYQNGSQSIFFVKYPEYEGNPDTVTELMGNGDIEFLFDDLKTPVNFCEFELYSSNINWAFQTFVSTMKEGQELEFIWEVDSGTTLELLEYELHVDQLTAILFDGEDHQYHFIIGTKAGSDKDVTRMVIGAATDNLAKYLN